MFHSILLPTDGSDLAMKAVRHGINIAKQTGVKLTAVTVVEPFRAFSAKPDQVEYTRSTYPEHASQHAREVLGAVTALASEAGVSCETVVAADSHPYEGIIKTARKNGCDLIMMGSHGRGGLSAMVLGSETQKVLTHSDIPVLVYR